MKCIRKVILLGAVLLASGIARSQQPVKQVDQQAILQVLNAQTEAWNRGDISAFMRGYQDAPDTTFVGKTVEQGYTKIVDRYRQKYGTKEQMGSLRFEDLQVRVLDAQCAVATGRFHLSRSVQAGGEAEGVFSLVFQKGLAAGRSCSITPVECGPAE